MKRVFLSFSSLLLITLLCDPAILFASKKQNDLNKFQDSRSGFIENKGQVIDQNNKPNPSVLYLSNMPGMNVQLRVSGFSYDLYSPSPYSPPLVGRGRGWGFHRIDIDLAGANPHPAIETSGQSSDYLNYYTTGTPVEGVTGVRSFATVTYKNIYPGIDLQFTNNENQFEYNFILKPGADINTIKMKVSGPQKIKGFREGIRCETTLGDVDETIPVCYYSQNNTRITVKGRFRKIADHFYGFAVDKAIPPDAVLTIDPIPTRRWGTYYGGTTPMDFVSDDLVVDPVGNVFVGGSTSSTSNIATAGAYQVSFAGVLDAFLVKFNGNGQRIWGTYYGGENWDQTITISRDPSNNVFIAGFTSSSTGIASSGAFQQTLIGGMDSFLAKFDPSGIRLWSTYFGGTDLTLNGIDMTFACVTDSDGNVYCAGQTSAPDFPVTPMAYQTTMAGPEDAFLIKFNTNGSRVWATFYGGSLREQDIRCCLSNNNFLYLSGSTNSPDNIATPGSFLSSLGTSPKGFLACFNKNGIRSWGTYFGGEGTDKSTGCISDTASSVYLYGTTNSFTNIATPGTYQMTKLGSDNAYLQKFNSSGNRLWGTYFGAGNGVFCGGAVDDSGFVFLTGGVSAQDTAYYSPYAYQTNFRGITSNAFLTKFSGNGQRIWSTYYGGTNSNRGFACVTDFSDNLYLTGEVFSDNNSDDHGLCTRLPNRNFFASPGSHQRELSGGEDVFLAKFSDCYSPDTASQIYGSLTICQNSTGNVYSIDPLFATTSYHWCVTGDLTISSGQGTVSITIDAGPTLGTDTISVYGVNACDNGFPKLLVVNIIPRPTPTITGNTSPQSVSIQTYTTETGKTNYQWTFSPGGSLVSGGGVNDPTITIQWNSGGAQWVRVNYTDVNGCAASLPTQLDITVTSTVTVDFTAPDTVCVGELITVNNLTQGGTTFYWNFCSGSANTDPTGVNIGNPGGLLNVPGGITLARDGSDCYSFVACQFVSGVVRYYHGTTFGHTPVSWTALGTFGILTDSVNGIQVANDNGNWYCFVTNNNKLARLSFGNSLTNTPTAVNLGPYSGFTMFSGLVIIKEGATWLGFATCSWGNKFVKFNFGNSLANTPVVTDFGNFGFTTLPGALEIIQENSTYYALFIDNGSNLVRLSFGNSLLNVPTAQNLGNPGGFNSAGGLTLLRDCSSTTGYWTNYLVNGQLGKLTFPSGITGSVSGTLLGNIGILNRPHTFSEIFRQNDTLFSYITNRGSYTLTRLAFPPCTNASVPSSNLFNPPPFSYNQPGTYNIHLIVDEGLPSMESMCKPVVVVLPPVVNLGSDLSVCPGNSVTLDAGAGFSSYLWSTGATTRTVVVSAAGQYWVEVSKYGCSARDTVNVSLYTLNPLNLGADTTVCQGVTRTYNAGPCPACTFQWDNLTTSQMNIGNGQTYTTGQAGKYRVTTTDIHGCTNRDTVQLFVTPVDTVKVTVTASAYQVCAGTSVTFTATAIHGGLTPTYQWKVNGINAGTNNPIFTYIPLNGDQVVCILTSSETCTSGNPASSITITMVVTNNLPAGVTIASPGNPFCPGSSVTITATPINGGVPSYQWKVNGINAGINSDTYTYTPANNDSIRCIMTSNLNCVTNNPASSNKIIMSGNLSPIVTFSSCFDTITTSNAKPIKLKGGIPPGGTYSGPGVSAGYYYPNIAGPGTHVINYSYTNVSLCTASKNLQIHQFTSSPVNCGSPVTDPRDNKVYQTVQLGTQCWLASNLNFGSVISSAQDQRDNCVAEKYCYNDNPANCLNQGGLYQWDELMLFDETPASQGFCPPAWHIPTENEWNTLFATFINNGFAGSPLKYSGYSGFNALLSGARHINKGWDFLGFATFFWSSTPRSDNKAWAHGLNDPDPSVSVYPASRVNAFSVRCLKD